VGAGLIAYGTAALFLFPVAEIEPGAWVLAGMLCRQVARPDELVAVELPRIARLVAQAALGGALAWAAFVGIRAGAADRAVRTALTDTARGDPASAVRAAASAVDRAPGDIVVRLAAARTDAALGTPAGIEDALGQVDAALRTSRRDPVLGDEKSTLLVQRARLTGSPGDWRAAAAQLQARHAVDPRNPAVLLQLGLADASLGHYGDATFDLQAARFLDPSSPAPTIDLALVGRMEGSSGTS
jgi:tetratricopeptide (TPR) repeat protein